MLDKRATQELQASIPLSLRLRSWYTDYKRFLFLLIPFFLLSLFVIFKVSSPNTHIQQDFALAKSSYLEWERSNDSASLQTLKGLLKKHPELVVPYETLIVQKLFMLGKAGQASPFIEHVLKRASQQPVTYYTQFARNTFLIENGTTDKDLQQALKDSLVLKEEMLSDQQFWKTQRSPHFGSVLFAFNLLRIAFLAEKLKNYDAELLAWQELKRYARWDNTPVEKREVGWSENAFNLLAKHFTEGKLSLQDYIKYRETTILSMQKKG